MAEPIKLTRYCTVAEHGYESDLSPADDGEAYLVGDVNPLLNELAELRVDFAEMLHDLARLRDRARMRDAATEPPKEGEWVLGVTGSKQEFVKVRLLEGYFRDLYFNCCEITGWWPLPEVQS